MIIRLFRNTQPMALVILILISASMWLISWMQHFSIQESGTMPFYEFLLKLLKGFPSYVAVIIGFILTTSQAIHLNMILNKHEVLYKASWLPALIYIFMAGLLPPFLSFHPVLFVNSILIFALDKTFSLYKNDSVLALTFDSAFLLAIASLFYLPAILLVVFLMAGIIILRPFSWRDWIAGLTGFALPFFFVFLYYFMKDDVTLLYTKISGSGISKKIVLGHIYIYEYTFTVVLAAILFVLSLVRLQTNYYKNVTKSRLIQQLLIILFLTGIFIAIIAPVNQLFRFAIPAVPLSVFIAYYFLSGKKLWIMETMFWLLAGGWIYNYFIFG